MVLITNKKPVKVGNGYYFNIPVKLLDSKIIDKDTVYNLEVNKIK